MLHFYKLENSKHVIDKRVKQYYITSMHQALNMRLSIPDVLSQKLAHNLGVGQIGQLNFRVYKP